MPRRLAVLLAALVLPLGQASVAQADSPPRPVTVDITAPWTSFAPNTPTLITAALRPADGTNVLSYCTTGGTLAFKDNGVVIAVMPVDQYCSAYVRPSFTPGDHLLTVDFSGNAQYLPGTGSLAVFAFTNQPFSGTNGFPGSTPPVAPPAPDPAPPAPDPAPPAAPTPPANAPAVSLDVVRSGLSTLSAVRLGARTVRFSQTIAAPGTITWTLSRGDGSPALGSATAPVTAGSVTGSIGLPSTARAWLRAHPTRKLLLRTRLALADGRVVAVSQRVSG
jgi:hypothetical protein